MVKKKNKQKKEQRKNEKRRLFNLLVKNRLKKLLKDFRSLVLKKELEKAKKLLSSLYKTLDKAVKQGIIKRGNADRKKSKMAKLLSRLEKK